VVSEEEWLAATIVTATSPIITVPPLLKPTVSTALLGRAPPAHQVGDPVDRHPQLARKLRHAGDMVEMPMGDQDRGDAIQHILALFRRETADCRRATDRSAAPVPRSPDGCSHVQATCIS
jgi:hypothetical protein